MAYSKMVSGFMKKKVYVYPQTVVTKLNTALMTYTGEASLPAQSGAPQRRTQVF